MSDEEENFDDEEKEEQENDEKEAKDDDEEGDKENDEEKEEHEEIPEIPLSEEMLPECLSLLCKTGDGLAHAFVRLDARDLDLTDIKILAHFIHLRYVDLSNNHLKDISPLSNLTHLLSLKCEKNLLTSAAIDPLPFLQSMNVNNNKIKLLEGINHPLLEHLSANFNEIRSLGGAFSTGLDPTILIRLHTLELRGNKLETTDGLYLPNLKNLFLAANNLKRLEGIERMTQLTTLHLRDNQIEKLDGFSAGMTSLQYLNLRGNNVSVKKELKKLQCLPMLRAIVLSENPISEEEDYRLEVLISLRKVIRLDKDEYAEEEREEAQQIYEQRLEEELANERLRQEKERLEEEQAKEHQEGGEEDMDIAGDIAEEKMEHDGNEDEVLVDGDEEIKAEE